MAPSSRSTRLLLPTTAMSTARFLLLLALCAAPAPAHAARSLTTPVAAATTKPQQGVATPTATTTNATSPAAAEYLEPHNQARAAVGVPPLRWSSDLSSAAAKVVAQQQRQGRCAFADMAGSSYGANQGWASYRALPGEVVASWVAQGKYYTHANNTCVAGKQCGTYTQVVWRRTQELGCAQASCATGATLTVCLYNPHGNVQGQSPY